MSADRTNSSDSEKVRHMIDEHYGNIRKHRIYTRSYIVVYFESNMSFIDSDRWARHLETQPHLIGRLEFARKDPMGRVGVWTTHAMKIAFAQELQKTVPTMTIATDFLTQSGDDDILAEMLTQFRQFRREVLAPKGDGMATLFNKIVITGKSPGKKDDLVMAVCIAIYNAFADRFCPMFQQKMRARNLVV